VRGSRLARLGPGLLAGVGIIGCIAAAALRPADAGPAAAQDWPPFVLVAGLLLIGLVADDDGLFAYAGNRLARLTRGGGTIFAGAVILIGVVTAVLNLDTSVAFLTPVLVYAARNRHGGEPALLYGCLLLSNAGSLLLPGSNLTNLIVLGHLHLTGGAFLARMWLPAVLAITVTAGVVAVAERRSLRGTGREHAEPVRLVPGVGLAAVVAATALVLTLRSPAVPVAAVGVVAAGIHLARRRATVSSAAGVLGLPVLTGLFGLAVALGTLGRAWAGPQVLLSHLDSWGTAAVTSLSTVLVNNLPAASLLAARTPGHPFALIVGLNLGPNLCVTGSLAWLLWLRAARSAGADPSLRRASRLGVIAVPLSVAAAVAALALTGVRLPRRRNGPRLAAWPTQVGGRNVPDSVRCRAAGDESGMR
jgi:arsenical pump membrane protein